MPRLRTSPFAPRASAQTGKLSPLAPSGRNPGGLAAYVHVPASIGDRPPLVVVLHGCTQTAGGYDHGSGWSTLADRHGFVLLFPEQQRANNANLCFNWFEPGDIALGKGEVESVRELIAQVVADRGIDPSRIFVTGLSAGGAMAAVMLAVHPELFAAGAIIGGLPHGFATSVTEALDLMRSGPRDAKLAGQASAPSAYKGRWPRLSIWHGDADRTVSPANAEGLVRQWTALHGLPVQPTRQEIVEGHPRRVWADADGVELIEDHLIAGMGHGTPIAPGTGADDVGAAGAYMLDVGISSSHEIARFWGILDAAAAPAEIDAAETVAPHPAQSVADLLPVSADATYSRPRPMQETGRSRPAPTGVQGIIEDALRSAGLMK